MCRSRDGGGSPGRPTSAGGQSGGADGRHTVIAAGERERDPAHRISVLVNPTGRKLLSTRRKNSRVHGSQNYGRQSGRRGEHGQYRRGAANSLSRGNDTCCALTYSRGRGPIEGDAVAVRRPSESDACHGLVVLIDPYSSENLLAPDLYRG